MPDPTITTPTDEGLADDALLRMILSFDVAGLAQLARDAPLLEAALITGWHDLFAQQSLQTLPARARQCGVDASAASDARAVLAANSLLALALLTAGDLAEATTTARRASRMAAAEGIATWGRFVNLVLARVRRHGGQPHLSLWICTILSKGAPQAFVPWLSWELWLSGRRPAIPNASPFTSALFAFLSVLHSGSQTDLQTESSALLEHSGIWQAFRNEAQALIEIADRAHPVTTLAQPFCLGQTRSPPFGLTGVCQQERHRLGDASTTALVSAAPGMPGRRVLRTAFALGQGPLALPNEPGHARTDTALSVLALAGPDGLDLATFFRSVYGFAYEAPLHRAVVDTLLHRMRKRLATDASVERTDNQLMLSLNTHLLIPDPRCGLEAQDVVLRALAEGGSTSANELASALAMPLRSVQAALQQLDEDGACASTRQGRRVVYQISDTTFTAATLATPT